MLVRMIVKEDQLSKTIIIVNSAMRLIVRGSAMFLLFLKLS